MRWWLVLRCILLLSLYPLQVSEDVAGEVGPRHAPDLELLRHFGGFNMFRARPSMAARDGLAVADAWVLAPLLGLLLGLVFFWALSRV